MRGVYAFLDWCRVAVRDIMRSLAKGLNKATKGRLHPNAVTMIGLIAHLPIAWLIATEQLVWAAILLVIFGLFDTLDGELARLQHRESRLGMLLDSISDRAKEAVLYLGVGYYLVETAAADGKAVGYFAVLAVAACAGSLLVSYVNAWGEVALMGTGGQARKVNQALRIGLMRFEIRMFVLAVGLLFDWLFVAVFLIALLSWVTALERIIDVSRRLNVQS